MNLPHGVQDRSTAHYLLSCCPFSPGYSALHDAQYDLTNLLRLLWLLILFVFRRNMKYCLRLCKASEGSHALLCTTSDFPSLQNGWAGRAAQWAETVVVEHGEQSTWGFCSLCPHSKSRTMKFCYLSTTCSGIRKVTLKYNCFVTILNPNVKHTSIIYMNKKQFPIIYYSAMPLLCISITDKSVCFSEF